MTDMELDDDEFDNLDLDDLIKLEEEAVVADHILMPDRSTLPPSNMSIVTSEVNGHDIHLESELRNLKHELNRMQRKLQEQDEAVQRKDQEIVGLKQRLSLLSLKTAPENRTFLAQKPMPKKPSKRHVDTQIDINTMKRTRIGSSSSPVTSSIPITSKAIIPSATPATLAPSSKAVIQSNQEDNMKLLRILYYDILYERKKPSHVITQEAKLWLASATRIQLTDEFILKLIPKSANLSMDQYGPLIHEIKGILLETSPPCFTLHALMHQINLCLSLSNKHRLHSAVKNLVTAIYRLLEQFPSTIRILYLDLVNAPSSSLIYTLADTLSLIGFENHLTHAISAYSNHPTTISEMKQLRRQYDSSFSEIADQLKTRRASDESYHSTLFILDIFQHINRNYQKSLFDFLMTNEAFLNLLSPDIPFEILIRALSILYMNFKKSQFSIDIIREEDKLLSLAQKLFASLDLESTHIGKEKLYELHINVLQVLRQLCKADLPSLTALVIQRETYKKSMDLMRTETVEMKKLLKRAEKKKQAEFIAKCFDTLYVVLKLHKENLFEFYEQNETYNFACISKLVLYMFEHISESHRAYIYVAAVERLLNKHVQTSA
ncbi:hypothetical protein BD560DRAFT_444062 [Blakeslea trispora]|nr:hypothetical protein BD560DRAFT_444062 [Blakeslea trispora]